MEMVGLSADFLDRYPHELSGGQLQRVCIARAVACEPEIILFDEAISSLDAHTQVQVMDLLIDLKEKLNLTYVFITHDLTSVTYLCDEVLFLYRGHITECRPVRELGKTTDVKSFNFHVQFNSSSSLGLFNLLRGVFRAFRIHKKWCRDK